MKKWFSDNLFYIIGSVVGAVAGYLYWQKIGCSSGTCAITSKPVNSILFGAVMGAVLFGLLKNKIKFTNKTQENDI